MFVYIIYVYGGSDDYRVLELIKKKRGKVKVKVKERERGGERERRKKKEWEKECKVHALLSWKGM